MDTFFLIMAFLCGTGFGWCLCAANDIVSEYVDKKRLEGVSEENWPGIVKFMTHRMVRDNYTGKPKWVVDDREFEEES